jgi:hypothetical protein
MSAYRLAVIASLISPAFAGTLSVRILDENGAPAPARVYLTDSSGKALFAPGSIVYDRVRAEASEQNFVPPQGAFRMELSAGTYALVVERGKEYLPVRERVEVPAQGDVERIVRLSRWVRMAPLGWYSADMHPHRPLADMPALMEAEDLNAALPITRWRRTTTTIEQDRMLDAFLEKSDAAGVYRVGKERWFTVLNEELEPRSSALLVSRLGRTGTSLEYPLMDYGRAARSRGALVDSEKATSLELPAIAALEGCDFVGLANNHFWRTACYEGGWGSWPDLLPRAYPRTCAGFGTAGSDLYYGLLNMGFPLKLSAGSASGVHPVPLGWSRIYVHVTGAFTPERWFEALKAGRSFVTTGPMLLLLVDGHEPGDDFGGSPRQVEARVRMLSPKRADAVEVVVNGRANRVPLAAVPGRNSEYSGTLRVRLDTSAWIAARWVEGRDIAHTSPVYYRVAGKPIPVPREQAAYFAGHVERLIAVVTSGKSESGEPAGIVSEPAEVKRRTMERLNQALAVYRAKLSSAQ